MATAYITIIYIPIR